MLKLIDWNDWNINSIRKIVRMKVGDKIYFVYNGEFIIDRIQEIVEVDGKLLITPEYYDWVTLTENDLLDDSDERVKGDISVNTEKMIKLSDARNWLKYHLSSYYESDCWSSFNEEQAVIDFCTAMVYNDNSHH